MEEVRPTTANPVRFGMFEVDLQACEVRKRGIKIKLQDQPFQILRILLEHAGEVVPREIIQKRIWPADTFVDFDHGLYNAIKRLRVALGDTAETPCYIETLPKHGYRFVGSLYDHQKRDPSEPKENVAVPAAARFRSGRFVLAVTAVLAAAAAALALDVWGIRSRFFPVTSSSAIHSLAVLPLQNLSGDPNQEYFADGMTDALITDLAQIGALKVISRTSTARYKKTDKSLPEIARELNVDGIVEGTVQRSGERVRITAQLIHAPTDKHLWASSYERDMRDVLSMEREIAEGIATEIRAKLTPAEQTRLAEARPVDLGAFEAYLQGNYHVSLAQGMEYHNGQQARIRSELGVARDFFDMARSKDPNYAPAYLGLARIWTEVPLAEGGPQKAREALQKALQLDPSLAEAHCGLGNLEHLRFWNWASSEGEFKLAIELNPNLADAHAGYWDFLDSMGRFDEGMREYLRTEELDPGHDPPQPNPFFTRREFDKAIEMDRNDIARHAFGPFPYWDMAESYEAKGMHDEAVHEWEIALRMLGYEDIANAMARGFKAKGWKGALKAWAREMEVAREHGENIPSFVLASVYTFLGDRDHAFGWLDKAYQERDPALPGVKVDPTWDNLRPDPRFQDLVRRLGLPQ